MATERTDAQALARKVDLAGAAWHYRRVMEALAIPIARETPLRHVEAIAEMTSGYDDGSWTHLQTTFPVHDDNPGMVIVKDIPFASLCEHHVLPFTGHVAVGYLPRERVVGLSKIGRLVQGYARRLTVQEHLTAAIADAMFDVIECEGVGVLVRGHHTCMALRGARQSAEMVTSTMRGSFLENPETRQEFLGLARSPS